MRKQEIGSIPAEKSREMNARERQAAQNFMCAVSKETHGGGFNIINYIYVRVMIVNIFETDRFNFLGIKIFE